MLFWRVFWDMSKGRERAATVMWSRYPWPVPENIVKRHPSDRRPSQTYQLQRACRDKLVIFTCCSLTFNPTDSGWKHRCKQRLKTDIIVMLTPILRNQWQTWRPCCRWKPQSNWEKTNNCPSSVQYGGPFLPVKEKQYSHGKSKLWDKKS